jgi:lipoate-protein ligase A
MTARSWRLLVDRPKDGATNMAIDEAVLRARIVSEVPPTVRFYGWDPPTVSLGYVQPLDRRIDREACARLGVGLVRRATGGSAILHESPEREVTYSVVARAEDFPGADDVLETYRMLGSGLVAGLARLAVRADLVPLHRSARSGAPPAFCFARSGAFEIAIAGRKLCGSAQRRQGSAFLQHGSLLLDADPGRLAAVFPGLRDPLGSVTTVAAVLRRGVGFDEAVDALAAGLAQALGVRLTPGELTAAEAGAADRLVAEKYGTEAWTVEGRVVGSARRGASPPFRTSPEVAAAEPPLGAEQSGGGR